MNVVVVSWYLCFLSLVALLAVSAVTVAPGGESVWMVMMTVTTISMIGSAAMALAFLRFGVPRARWLPKLLSGVAIGSTLIMLLSCVS